MKKLFSYGSTVAPRALVLWGVWALCGPLAAQDFDAQKRQLNAMRLVSFEQLGDLAPTLTGKTIELRGKVKGIFSRGADFALFLEIAPRNSVLIQASPALRIGALTRAGSVVRVLCEVTGFTGREVDLELRAFTDKPASPPEPETIISDGLTVGREVQSPVATRVASSRPVAGAPAGKAGLPKDRSTPPQTLRPFGIPATPARAKLSSRGAQTQSRNLIFGSNPFFGFSDEHRASYANLALSNNARLSRAQADEIAAAILSASATHKLDPRFLAAVVTVESRFNPRAISESGALGLGQLMPFNLAPLGVRDPWDPMQNLHGAAKMLRRNLDTYGERADGTLLAVAAYHAGIGAVRRAGYRVPKVSTNRYAWKVYYAYKDLAPELFR